MLQLSGTADLDHIGVSLREGLSSLSSLAATGLVTALLITGLVYLVVGTSLDTKRRRKGEKMQLGLSFTYSCSGYDLRRKYGSTLSGRFSRILSYVSENSLDDLVDTIKPLMFPTISRVGSGKEEHLLLKLTYN